MKDFTKLRPRKKTEAVIDPYDIFRKNVSKMSSSGINDLWAGQRDALREWYKVRDSKDVALVLNTGAGKTLIGLLVAQSILNETKGKIFYLCGSIQLIEQTREKAEIYGIDVTTYHGGSYNNHLFEQGDAICITTYQALFNGRSKFRNEEIEAILFDDSHAAENLVKNCFSIEIERAKNQDTFDKLIQIFRPYYQKVGKHASFDEIFSGQNEKIELFPPFEVNNNISEIRSILEEGGIAENTDTLFGWHHLKDYLDLCSYFVSSGKIQITPPFIPANSLPYFSNSIRRVYLTATLLGEDNFIRTFGRSPTNIIVPDTPAGECERQILFPLLTEKVLEDRLSTQSIIQDSKALIIAPNNFIASQWSEIGVIPSTNELHEAICLFKESDNNEKIIITARYDGIDLPGDTCRTLVMDGLPTGAALIDKYHWEVLRLSNTLRSVIACRVIQSLGRISRGMSDYGVVIICDKSYVNWLQNSKNQAFLPSFIQKQLNLGLELSKDCHDSNELKESMQACLNRTENWINGYEAFMEDCEVENRNENEELLIKLATAETKFINKYWLRDYVNAAKKLINVLTQAESINTGLAAWYSCWIAHCCEIAGDSETASFYYKQANNLTRETPRFINNELINAGHFTDQVLKISNQLQISSGSQIQVPKSILTDMKYLDGSGTVNQTEQALKELGSYLGFDSSRPDNEHSIGPDVLWIDSGVAIAIEAKTEKGTEYTKRDIGQLYNHIEWIKVNHKSVHQTIPLFVGPIISATDSSSPSDDLMVCELATFEQLGKGIIAAYDDIVQRAMPISLLQEIETIITQRALTIDELINSMNFTALKEL